MRTHISLNVRDISTTVDFYKKIFGQEPQKKTDGYAKFDLQEPKLNFSLIKATENRELSRVNHFGIEVTSEDEVSFWQERLESLNIEVLPEENTNCCYARQDKFWFRDPDGNSWEVFYVHEQLPIEAAEPPKNQTQDVCSSVSGCC